MQALEQRGRQVVYGSYLFTASTAWIKQVGSCKHFTAMDAGRSRCPDTARGRIRSMLRTALQRPVVIINGISSSSPGRRSAAKALSLPTQEVSVLPGEACVGDASIRRPTMHPPSPSFRAVADSETRRGQDNRDGKRHTIELPQPRDVSPAGVTVAGRDAPGLQISKLEDRVLAARA